MLTLQIISFVMSGLIVFICYKIVMWTKDDRKWWSVGILLILSFTITFKTMLLAEIAERESDARLVELRECFYDQKLDLETCRKNLGIE